MIVSSLSIYASSFFLLCGSFPISYIHTHTYIPTGGPEYRPTSFSTSPFPYVKERVRVALSSGGVFKYVLELLYVPLYLSFSSSFLSLVLYVCLFVTCKMYEYVFIFFYFVFPTLTLTLALTYTHKYIHTSPRGTLVVDLSVTVQALPHTHQPNVFMFKKADTATTTITTTTEVVPPPSSSLTSGRLNN